MPSNSRLTNNLWWWTAGCALVLLASACAGTRRGSESPTLPSAPPTAVPTSAPRPDGLPTFDIWAGTSSYRAPDSVPAGRLAVTLHNEGNQQRNAQFFRVNDGVSLAQVAAAFQRSPRSAVDMLTFEGGPGTVTPGGTQAIVQDLKEGQYVMATLLLGEDGQQYVPSGMFKTFRVTAAPPQQPPALPGDRAIVLSDFAFGIPQLEAGKTTLQLRNVGAQPHEILVKRLEGTKTVADALGFVLNPVGTPPYSDAGGFLVFPGGQTTSLTLDLLPGPYVAICYFRDAASGKTHAELGMIRDFTVD